jgi:hypothetical protein
MTELLPTHHSHITKLYRPHDVFSLCQSICLMNQVTILLRRHSAVSNSSSSHVKIFLLKSCLSHGLTRERNAKDTRAPPVRRFFHV